MLEKRKSNRLSADEETFVSQDNGQKTGIKLVDISIGGMKAMLNENLKTGTVLLGKFSILPRLGPFYIKGEVAWSKPCREKNNCYKIEIGVKFTKINTIPI